MLHIDKLIPRGRGLARVLLARAPTLAQIRQVKKVLDRGHIIQKATSVVRNTLTVF